jgi:hypothetical protein
VERLKPTLADSDPGDDILGGDSLDTGIEVFAQLRLRT